MKGIESWLEQQRSNNQPFVLFSLPNSTSFTAYFQLNDLVSTDPKTPSFVVAPFKDATHKIFIRADEQQTFSFQETEQNSQEKFKFPNEVSIGKEDYQSIIKKAIFKLHETEFKKVVLSRKIEIPTTSYDPLKWLKNARLAYPNAFVYHLYHPSVGEWLGATPEQLLQFHAKQFQTMALAGTKSSMDQRDWGEKEIEEQALVTETIVSALKTSEIISDLKIDGPKTIRAGALEHLCTTILGSPHPKTSCWELINVLHPTAAVGGIPKKAAVHFIVDNETYDRELYTGYLGPVHGDSANLFVNLRCMQIHSNSISIYVGGGITAKSNPESEWQETIEKTRTMLRLIL